MSYEETIEEHYKNCRVVAYKYVNSYQKDEFGFMLYHNDEFLFRDCNTIDGSQQITNIRQAINEGKKNVDSLIRTNSLDGENPFRY